MLSRTAPALAVALFAFSACASPVESPIPAGPPASRPIGALNMGRLYVEPREIVYSRRRGKRDELPVRVEQRGFTGEYTMRNRCAGVTVTLRKYTIHNASIWNVGARQAPVESCVVVFTGSNGARGTNSLHISILR